MTSYTYGEALANLAAVKDEFFTFIPKEWIQGVATQLYVTSLTNGRFHHVAVHLEKNIQSFLNQTRKEVLRGLTTEASRLLEINPKDNLDEIGDLKKKLLKIYGEADQVLSLFCYIDSSYQIPVGLLIRHSQFIQCKKFFGRFIQQLSICQNERAELISLRAKVHGKLLELDSQAKPLYSSSQALSQRDIFFSNHFQVFWDAGVEIIQQAFKETFKEAHIPKKIQESTKV